MYNVSIHILALQVYEDKLVWTRHWDSEGQIPIRCTTPKHLRDFKVLNMRSGDFTCDSPPELVRMSEGPTVVAYLNSDVIFEVGICRWKTLVFMY